MRLMQRAPVAQPEIQPLSAPPPSLPPPPEKKALKPKPVVKKTSVVNRPPPLKKTAAVPPPRPPVQKTEPQQESEPPPSAAMTESEPAVPQKPPATETAASPKPPRASERIFGEKTGTVAAVVRATPRYNHNPPPVYPSIARKRGYQGTAVLEVFVKMDGRVGDLRIIESSGHKLLDRSAMKAVRRWQFQPGHQGERTVAMWVQVPVQFILD